ncbi:MAG: glycosyltransferase [Solirubrobacterales bacterium]
MLLSVVVVTWNTRDLVLRSVESVLEHTEVEDMEVVVVDNASSDGTAAALRERFPAVRMIENDENVGGPAGFNQGMRVASGEVILLMQNDGYVGDDVIGRMAAHMAEEPDLAMLGCELRYPDGRHQYTARRQMSIWHSAVERFWLYKLFPPRLRDRMLLDGYWPAEQETEADWLAAMQMVSREAFVRTGGFDERFWGGGEEAEWARRVRGLGYRVKYVPRLGVIFHVGSASWTQVWSATEQLRRWHRLGVESYAAQHGGLRGMLYRVVETAGVAFRWTVHSAVCALGGSEYHEHQARHYRMLLGFYLRPTEVDRKGRRGDTHLR